MRLALIALDWVRNWSRKQKQAMLTGRLSNQYAFISEVCYLFGASNARWWVGEVIIRIRLHVGLPSNGVIPITQLYIACLEFHSAFTELRLTTCTVLAVGLTIARNVVYSVNHGSTCKVQRGRT
jgi:hypothetical protein